MRALFGITSLLLVAGVLYTLSAKDGQGLLGPATSSQVEGAGDKAEGVLGSTVVAEGLRVTAAEYVSSDGYPPTAALIERIKADDPFRRFADRPSIGALTVRTIDADNIEICTKGSGQVPFYCARQRQGGIVVTAGGASWKAAQRAARAKLPR